MLDQITPIILTYNEAPNIAWTLEPLQWAREIIVVDSLSNYTFQRVLAELILSLYLIEHSLRRGERLPTPVDILEEPKDAARAFSQRNPDRSRK